ncbi:MAG: hypothetical protein AAB738_02865 [Patescibacteria group bacterium]
MVFQEIKWEAPEFEYREKTVLWYWVVIAVATGILALTVWQKNFLFGVFVIMAGVMIIVWGNREPRMAGFKLTQDGLVIDERKTYAYKEMEGFALDDSGEGEWAQMFFKFKSHLKTKLKISLPKTESDEIRKVIGSMAPEVAEVEWEHSFIDSLERLIGF